MSDGWPFFFFFPLFFFFGALFLAALAFHIWMLVDAIRRPEAQFDPPSSRTWWIVGMAAGFFVSPLGLIAAIAYFFVVRQPAKQGRAPVKLPVQGAPSRYCPSCGVAVPPGARFCPNCGNALP